MKTFLFFIFIITLLSATYVAVDADRKINILKDSTAYWKGRYDSVKQHIHSWAYFSTDSVYFGCNLYNPDNGNKADFIDYNVMMDYYGELWHHKYDSVVMYHTTHINNVQTLNIH